LQRAREQAARIVAEAKANATPTAAEATGDRPAVDAFLQQERAFLQELAGLVQGHAESVKAMARKTRQPADAASTRGPASTEPASGSRPAPAAEAKESPAPKASEEQHPGGHTQPAEGSAGAGEAGDETVVIEVPQPATTSAGDRDTEGGDPSLKKLFWGEER
jgi:hypothetical protein